MWVSIQGLRIEDLTLNHSVHRSMMHQCAVCQCFISVNSITGVVDTTAESESGGTPRYYCVAILDGDGYALAVVSVNTAGTTVIIAPISLSTSLLLPIIALPLTTVYNAVNLLPFFLDNLCIFFPYWCRLQTWTIRHHYYSPGYHILCIMLIVVNIRQQFRFDGALSNKLICASPIVNHLYIVECIRYNTP